MQNQVVILSLSLAAASTGTAVWLAMRGPQPATPAKTDTSPRAAGSTPAAQTANASPTSPATDSRRTSTSSSQQVWEKDTVGIGGLIREDVQTPAPPARPGHVSEVPPAELAERVARIEKATSHEMRRLVGLLNLSDEQQDQVYEKLAASSRHWVPGMAVAAGGDGTGTIVIPDTTSATAASDASQDIMSLLNADQQDTFLQTEMDRAAWWAEIITQLDAQTEIPAIDGTPAPNTEGEVKPYEGSDILE